ncbi:MAG: type VII toxin-antitoxin system MntA family adenylyltransferase antitoxin [Nanoarchaeota archaeon]
MQYESFNLELKKKLQEVSKKYQLKLFIIFGSRQNNNYKINSDWDFAFYPNEMFNYKKEMKLFEEIQNILKYDKIDLLNIKTSNNLNVINNIFQKGKLIYESKDGLYKLKKWSAWIDLQDFKRYYNMQSKLDEIRLKKLET